MRAKSSQEVRGAVIDLGTYLAVERKVGPRETVGDRGHRRASDAIGIVHQTFEAPTSEERLPFIFDIDVFKVGDYDPADNVIWADFERLRDFKNEVFFRSITEKTRELFL